MAKNRILSSIFFLMIHLALVWGQSSYIFRHFSTDDGLLNNEVTAIIKDQFGFLWIGTVSGLNRYDGYRLKSYTNHSDDPYSLPEDNVESLQEDSQGNIWIGGRNTYAVYQRERDYFIDAKSLLERMGIPAKGGLSLIHIDTNGDLWAVVSDTLFHYQYKKMSLKQFILPCKAEELQLSDDGKCLWLIDGEGRLFEVNQEGTWTELSYPADWNKMNRVYRDKSGGIWLYSTWNDEIRYRQDGENDWRNIRLQSKGRTQSNFTRSMQDDGKGNVWIATDHKGLFLYNKVSGEQTNILHQSLSHSSISENSIGCILLDDKEVLWVGYVKKGLSCYHPSFCKFVNYREPQFENISAVLEDRGGRVWIGTDGYGLVCKQPDGTDILRKVDIPGNIVVTLMEDNRGRIWIGTYLNGLLCYANGKLKQWTTANSALADNSIYTLRQDRLGKIWIGTLWGHLQCLHPDTGSFENFPSQSKDQSIAVSMHYEGGDTLYAGMISGLCLLDIRNGNRQMHFGNRQGTMKFKQPFIQSVCKDRLGNIWLGHNQGITVWDMRRDTLYYLNNKSIGLCDNVIRGIAADERNRLWITTSNGCSAVTCLKDADGVLSFRCDNYSVKDGLPGNNFSRHSLCSLRDGRMLLGGVDGYSLVNLSLLSEGGDSATHVVFTGLQIAGNKIGVGVPYQNRTVLKAPMEQQNRLELDYSDRLIRVEYTAMNLIAPDKVRYAYRLKGMNDEWFYTTDTYVTFNSLPPGRYQLLVKAMGENGQWNEATPLFIDVAAPFYLSWYAYLFYVLLFTLCLLAWWKQLKRKHRLHLEQEHLRMEYEQTIRLNEMKLRFFTNVSHDFRTPLTLIITPLQRILESGELEMKNGETSNTTRFSPSALYSSLKTIYRNAEQLLTLVNQLLDFRKLDVGGEPLHPLLGDFTALVRDTAQPFRDYAAERRMTFCIQDEVGTLMLYFDADKLRKIVSNLLSNAFKYTSDGGTITLRIFHEEKYACVSVADTGIGIPDADKRHIFERFFQTRQKMEYTGSGIGLHIVNEYVRLHQGIVSVADNSPQGSIFTFCLPIAISTEEEEQAMHATEESEQEIPLVPFIEKSNHATLLLVEDNRELCDFMSKSLGSEFCVLTAGNGQEALDLLATEDVNIVISDVMMPVIDGMELCRRIKNDIRISHIPVLLLTARTAEEYRLQGLEMGADDYLTKPFNYNVLLLRIRKFIEWTEKCHRDFQQKLDVSPGEITITPMDEQFINKAIQVVEEHIDNSEFSVEELSAVVSMTRGHLYKKLMSITGKSPSDFIRIIRLKRARQLLAESQLQVAEIAYSVGFSSPKIFSRNFKAEFGMTPTEYIKNETSKSLQG